MVELVPYYPLAPLIFAVAAVYFALAMSRHLRVFAAAQPSRPFDRPIDRAIALGVHVFGQVRMFRDVRPALMHLAIFYGFLAITVISANYFSFGLVESVLSLPLDALPWRLALVGQNIISVLVIVAIAYALVRRLVTRPRRLTLSVDALVILLLIGGVVLSGLLADAFLIARHRTGRKKATYTKQGSRAKLAESPRFRRAFARARARVARMDVRWVGEPRQVQQALLEIYAATLLGTKYNDFDTH